MAQNVRLKDRFRVVVNCLVYYEGLVSSQGECNGSGNRYLILHRRPDLKVYPGLWAVPGGGVEEEDYVNLPQTSPRAWNGVLETVLRREVREEAGIDIGPVEFLNDFLFIRPDGIPVLGLRYAAPALSTNVVFDPLDSQAFAWVWAHELDAYAFIPEIPDEIRGFDAKHARRTKASRCE